MATEFIAANTLSVGDTIKVGFETGRITFLALVAGHDIQIKYIPLTGATDTRERDFQIDKYVKIERLTT